MNILIADDHAVVRRGLREILEDAIPRVLFYEASDGDQVLRCLAESEFSALLLDINMPGRSGFEVLQYVKRKYARLPVIVVSVQPQDQYAMRCLRAGAAAYINKDNVSEELAPVVRKVLLGGRSAAASLAQ